jgi:gliding motility-associated-like protein
LNIGTTGDQLFLLQGGNWDNGVLGQHDATFNGLLVYAYNNKGAWVPFTNSAGDSGLPAELQPCYFYNTSGPAQPYSSYSGPMEPTTKENWAIRITNNANWTNFGTCANYQFPPNFYEILPFEWEDFPTVVCPGGEGFELPGSIAGVGGSWSGPGVNGNQFSPGTELGEVILVFTPQETCHPLLEIILEIQAGEELENPFDPAVFCKEDIEIALPESIDGVPGVWSGPGVNGNFFNASGLPGSSVELTFAPLNNDCVAPLLVVLTLEDPAPVILNSFPSICNLSSPISLPGIQDGAAGDWSGEGIAGGNVFDPSGLSGPVELVFTPQPGQCRLSSSTTINVIEAVEPTLQNLPLEICSSEDPLSLSSIQSGIEGAWSGPGVSGPAFVWDPSGLSGTVQLQFTPSTGICALLPDPVEIEVLESPLIFLESNVNPAVLCPGESLILSASGQGGNPLVFTWTLPGGAQESGPNLLVEESGTYTVIGSNGNCSSDPLSILIESSDPIVIENTLLNPANCNGEEGSIEIFASGGTGTLSIEWQDGQNTFFLGDLAPGFYSFTLSDELGCSTEGSVEILQDDELPNLLLDLPESVCSDDPIANLSFVFSNGQEPFSVTFSLNGVEQNPLTGNSSPLTTELTINGETLVSILEFSAGGCLGSVLPENAFIGWSDPLEYSDLSAECLGNQIEYIVTFQILNYNPGATYTLLPLGSGSINNNGVFISNGIPLGVNYSFTIVEQGSPCLPLVISGPAINNCGCLSQPGLMPQSLNELCSGDTLMVTPIQEAQVVSPEIALYYLHDNPGPTLGNIIAISTTPSAVFDPTAGMQLGQIYYLSSVVGPDNGIGEIDLTDDCSQVSSGTPVRWTASIEVQVEHPGFLCPGEDLLISFSFLSDDPVTVTLKGDQQTPFTITLDENPTLYLLEAGLFSDSIVLLNVNPNACPGTWIGELVIPIISPLDTSQWTVECDEADQSYSVTFELLGNAPAFTLIEGEGNLVGNVFSSDALDFDQIFSISITDVLGCDTLILTLEDLCALNDCQPGDPTLQLAEENLSNCPENLIPVFLTLEKPDSLYTYSWQVPYPPFLLNEYPLNALGGGEFSVIITDIETGCTSDTLFFEILQLEGPDIQNLIVECTGQDNEYIIAFEIQGGDVENYAVTPAGSGSLDSNIFTSNPIEGGEPYSFVIEDGGICDPIVISGVGPLCNGCTLNAGTLNADTLIVCDGEDAVLPYLGGYNGMPGQDTLLFFIHTNSTFGPTGILASSDSPFFNWSQLQGLDKNRDYYVFAVASAMGGSQGISFEDDCLIASQPMVLRVEELTTLTVISDPFFCYNSNILISFNYSGDAPYKVGYALDQGDTLVFNSLTVNSVLVLDAGRAKEYIRIVWIESSSGCPGIIQGIDSLPIVPEILQEDISFLCDEATDSYTITLTLSGLDDSNWENCGDDGQLQNNIFSTEAYPSGSPYSICLTNSFGCNALNLAGTGPDCSLECQVDAGFILGDEFQIICTSTPNNFFTISRTTGGFSANPGEVIRYYLLRTFPITQPSDIITDASNASFSISNPIIGQSYFVVGIAGTDNGAGFPDLNGDCLDYTNVIEIQFRLNAIRNVIVELCPNQFYEVGGEIFDINRPSGAVVFEGGAVNTCDSIVNVTLEFKEAIDSTYTAVLCSGETLVIGGVTFDESNPEGQVKLASGGSNQCDTLVSLFLTFLPHEELDTLLQLCEGDNIVINGTLYDENRPEGTEIIKGAGSNGCDLVLTVKLSFTTLDVTIEAFPSRCLGSGGGYINIFDNGMSGEIISIDFEGEIYEFTNNYQLGLNLTEGSYPLGVFVGSCRLDTLVEIGVALIPELDLGPDLTLTLGQSGQINGLSNLDPQSWLWSPTLGLSCTNCLNPRVNPTQTTLYTLTIVDNVGCSASASLLVTVLEEEIPEGIFIPNAFSPNLDGVNDFFYLQADRNLILNYDMTIFNRWGDVVYKAQSLEPSSSNGAWDGRFRGRELNADVYTYLIEARLATDKKTRLLVGDVTLLK